jgi:hypothetical protein
MFLQDLPFRTIRMALLETEKETIREGYSSGLLAPYIKLKVTVLKKKVVKDIYIFSIGEDDSSTSLSSRPHKIISVLSNF